MTTPIEIVFVMDTTGSMSPAIAQVRRDLEKVITELFKEVPGLKIGIGAHGDYGDELTSYLTTYKDLTTDIHSLVQFTRNTGRTYGADWPEAMELVLHEAKTEFSWSLNSKKILIMVGDAVPHEVNSHRNRFKLDWKHEVAELVESGISVYSVQCLPYPRATPFWQDLAKRGNGYYLVLDQFAELSTLIQAVVYQQAGPEALEVFENRVEASGRMSRALDRTFDTLAGRPRDSKGRFLSTKSVTSSGETLKPVDLGAYQIMEVPDGGAVIRDFVESQDIDFKPGRGFYELTKAEGISDKKEIIVRNRKSGDVFTGPGARDLVNIPWGMTTKQKRVPRYDRSLYEVFVQSTSYNRKLVGGTKFLYEVPAVTE